MSLVLVGDFRTVNAEHESTAKDGQYVGLEKMPNLTPDDRDAAWFHENTLLIRNDEAILDKVPVTIRHGKKTYSASDGGFLTYRARFAKKDGHAKPIRRRILPKCWSCLEQLEQLQDVVSGLRRSIRGGLQQPLDFLLVHDKSLILASFFSSHGYLFIPVTHRAGNGRFEAGMNLADAGALDEGRHVVIFNSTSRHDGDAAGGGRHQTLQDFGAFGSGLFAARCQDAMHAYRLKIAE